MFYEAARGRGLEGLVAVDGQVLLILCLPNHLKMADAVNMG